MSINDKDHALQEAEYRGRFGTPLDLTKPPPTDAEMFQSEASYRRGFYQAVATAVERICEGATVDDLAKWAEVLRKWRRFEGEQPHKKLEMTLPPSCPRRGRL